MLANYGDCCIFGVIEFKKQIKMHYIILGLLAIGIIGAFWQYILGIVIIAVIIKLIIFYKKQNNVEEPVDAKTKVRVLTPSGAVIESSDSKNIIEENDGEDDEDNNDSTDTRKYGILEKTVSLIHKYEKKYQKEYVWGLITLLSILLLFIPLVFILIAYITVYFRTLKYYNSDDFTQIKERMKKQIKEYNEFNSFLSETRYYIHDKQHEITDYSTYYATLTVYKNAQLDPYKYLIKYFFKDKTIDESKLQIIESILQKYNTIEKTYSILQSEYYAIEKYINNNMYIGAYVFSDITMKRLGSQKLPQFNRDYYMSYHFSYTSPTDRNHYSYDIVLNESELIKFAEYLNSQIKYRKSAKYQRQLMTPQLREQILSRDKYKCKKCGVSKKNEKHLLLEVDHIIPISKGGITIESNLQALCWKCNRTKGAKIE